MKIGHYKISGLNPTSKDLLEMLSDQEIGYQVWSTPRCEYRWKDDDLYVTRSVIERPVTVDGEEILCLHVLFDTKQQPKPLDKSPL